ncbi:putative cytochrome p450 protein [Phaeoacremonium minimum UCRPA7]|uniref:Putative cytochrome p450 protein n=1 Tax=Phaeoacremonium minimum (strain UCR-PA7) TaxID=1286976 RepID=R8BJ01_PHAM7|nr:putative cytochrome p450 protein [Phaeoacremonium minimum UCRPA7]EON99227.1 putative cytochrome p450 protein [Phaeoacremonium minimum UCRPA7]
MTKETSETLFRICNEIQSPIAQLFFKPFSRPYVVLNDPREVQDILIVLPQCTLAQQTTPKLKAQKRLWSDVMGTGFLRRVVAPRLHDAGIDLVEYWRLKAAKNDGEAFYVYEDFECAALDAIWAAIIGTHLGLIREKMRSMQPDYEAGAAMSAESDVDGVGASAVTGRIIREGIGYINQVVEEVVLSPFPAITRWWIRKRPALLRHRREMEKEIRKVIIASCERFDKAIEAGYGDDEALDTCAMDLVLRREILTAKKKGLPMPTPASDPSFQSELQLLLQAAADSTSHTLSWFVKFMSAYQQVQTKFRAELRRVFPGPGLPSAAQILDTDIPYLDAVVEETLRLSVTAGVVPREVVIDTQILGCHIPKGTIVFLSTRVQAEPLRIAEERRSDSSRAAIEKRSYHGLHGQEAQNLDVFEPSRWITPDEKGNEMFDVNTLPTLWFGGGFRGCFGRKLAMQELRIMAALLVLSFEFLPLQEHLSSMVGEEHGLFRRPAKSFARIRAL